MTETRPWRGRPRFGGALLVGALVVACSGQAAGPSPSTANDPSRSATVATSASAETTRVDGVAALAKALRSLQAGYRFQSVVTLDGEPVTTVSGEASGEAVQAVVASGGAEVEYLVTPEGSWVRTPGEEWSTLAGPAPITAPLAQLLAYQDSELVDWEGDGLVLTVTYPPAALGLDGADPVDVEVTVSSGVVARISYLTPVGERWAEVVTNFGDVGATPPLTIPGPTGG